MQTSRHIPLLLACSLFFASIAFGVNPSPTSDPDCDPYKTCDTCDGPDSVPQDESCPTSFNYSLGVGSAYVARGGNFLTHSRTGIAEGQGGKSHIRSFDDVRESIMDTGNYRNTRMLSLTVVQDRIDSRLYSPAVFDYLPLPGTEFIKQNGILRQVVTLSAFSDIQPLGNGFEVKTWNISAFTNRNKVNGIYLAPAAAPIKTTKFTNPDFPDENNRLVISSSENFSGNGTHLQTHLYTQTNRDLLTVETFEGADLTGRLMERLTLIYSNRGARPWDYSAERKIERASNTNGIIGGLVVVLHNFETYRDFSKISPDDGDTKGGDKNGKRLISKITAYNTPQAQNTVYDYYRDKGDSNINGRLKSQRNPDGSWEYWEYLDAEKGITTSETKYSSWKDVPFANYRDGVREHTVINENEAFRTVTIQGQQVSREKYFTAKDEATGQITYTQSKWDGGAWADEITRYASSKSGTTAAARPIWRTFADGTAETIAYTLSNGQLAITVSRGDNGTGTAALPVITAGTRTVTRYNATGMEASSEAYDIASGLPLSMETGVEFDSSGRVTKKVFNANFDDYEITRYGCCGLEFSRDRTGATTTYFRDNLKRVHRVIRKSSSTDEAITTVTAYNGLTTTTTRSDGTTTLLVADTTETLDGLTRTTLSPDANGDGNPETTTQVIVRNAATGSTTTTTHPDGTTGSQQEFLDGSMKSSTDQAGHITTYDKNTHNLNGGGLFMQTTAANGTQWEKTYEDAMGRTFRTEFADGAIATRTYHPFAAAKGSRGNMASSTDPDGITVTYAFNGEGEQTTTTTPMPGGQTQTTVNDQDVVQDPFTGVAYRSRTTVNGVLISTSLRGTHGYRSKSVNHLANGSISTSERTVPNDGAWTETTTSPDGTYRVNTTTDGLTVKQESFGSDDALIMSGGMTYDAFDRVLTQTDSRTGITTMGAYLENGAVTSVTDPGGRTTAFTYDVMGRTLAVDAPDTLDADGNTLANIAYTSYTARGEVAGNWGGQTNPTFNVYDALGRMSELRTYQTLAQGTEPVEATAGYAKTTWSYSPDRGFLNAKRDAADKGAGYTYTPAGRLATRTWARSSVANPKVTTYTYDAGMLVSTNYSDTTPDVTFTYDNFGRPLNVRNGIGTLVGSVLTIATPISNTVYTYETDTLTPDTETVTYDINTDGTPELTRTLDRSQDNLLRNTGWQLKNGATIENSAAYLYSATDGRLFKVMGLASPGLASPEFAYGYEPNSYGLIKTVTGPAHTVTNTWETNRNVLASKGNEVATTNISTYSYGVNPLGQRTNVAQTGSAFDSTRDLTWGYDALGQVTKAQSNIPGLDRAYAFDMIGNRLSGGGLNPPSQTSYTANALNQYTAIGSLNPVHDEDGNMTSGPLPANVNTNSTLVWDGENRLIEAQVTGGGTVTYSYDAQSRRIAETVGGATKLTIHDGWNPIAEYGSAGFQPASLAKSYIWGIDLSGTMQGAGGVGGLLMVTVGSAGSADRYFPTYDGNGNVSEYLDSVGVVQAHYEYDPFGKTTVATGPKVNDFAHRFSTKPLDATTGLYYYGYRYYDPNTGRWPSRDPIAERGGVNLYGFVGNDGVNRWDYLGLQDLSCEADESCGETMSCLKEHYEGTDAGTPSSPTTTRQKGTWFRVGPILQTTAGDGPLDLFGVNQWDEKRIDTLYSEQTRIDIVRYRKWCTVYTKDYIKKCDGWVRRKESITVTTKNKIGTETVRRIVRTTHAAATGWAGPIIATDHEYYGGYTE